MGDLTAKEKFPNSYRLDHSTFGDVRKTTYAKGVIQDFDLISADPLLLKDTCSVECDGETFLNVPIFFHCFKGTTVTLASDLSLKSAAWGYQVSDEVLVMMQDGEAAAVLGLWDRAARLRLCRTLMPAKVSASTMGDTSIDYQTTFTYIDMVDQSVYHQHTQVGDHPPCNQEILDQWGINIEASRYEGGDYFKDPHFCGLVGRQAINTWHTWENAGADQASGMDDLYLLGPIIFIIRHLTTYHGDSEEPFMETSTSHGKLFAGIYTPDRVQAILDLAAAHSGEDGSSPDYPGLTEQTALTASLLESPYNHIVHTYPGFSDLNNYFTLAKSNCFYPQKNDPWPVPGTHPSWAL